ncbi:MAG: hypothetical protein M3271_03920 [Actinomycetota bacterium]|nr:hypothetical protein [Actinomycetota bacterium]
MSDPDEKSWLRLIATVVVVILASVGLFVVGGFVLLSIAMANYGSAK